MSSYTPVSCRSEEEEKQVLGDRIPTETDRLLDDDEFVCISDNEADKKPEVASEKPLPTNTSDTPTPTPAEAPADASSSETKDSTGVSEMFTTTATSLKIELNDGVYTIVSSSSTSGAPLQLSEAMVNALRAQLEPNETNETEGAAKSDTTNSQATSPSQMSPEKLAVVKKAKQAEIKAATAKDYALESQVDEANSIFAAARAEFDALVERQKGVEEAQIKVFQALADMSTQRAALRQTRNEIYREALFSAVPTGDVTEKLSIKFDTTVTSLNGFTEKIDGMSQTKETLKRIQLTLDSFEHQIDQQKDKLITARHTRNLLKKQREEQGAIMENLERELAQL